MTRALPACLVLVLSLSACSGSAPPTAAAPGSAAPARTDIATGLQAPWGLAFLPGGDALVSERDSARILRIPSAGGRPAELTTITDARPQGEGGLLGLAVAPGEPANPWIYAYLTAEQDNRVVRFRLDAPDRPEVVLDGISKAGFHNGGRIAFGPDGMLYIATGDAGATGAAQDPDDLNGKILRVRPDGSVPADNPMPGSAVWSLGHRNVQGLAWDAARRMYATEFGQNTTDEVNLIKAGANYGWPEVEGVGGEAPFTDPIVTWRTSEASPSGAAVVGSTIYVAALRGRRLWTIPLAADGTAGRPVAQLNGTLGRLRTVAAAPDGSLWVVTSNTDGRGDPADDDDRILRLAVSS